MHAIFSTFFYTFTIDSSKLSQIASNFAYTLDARPRKRIKGANSREKLNEAERQEKRKLTLKRASAKFRARYCVLWLSFTFLLTLDSYDRKGTQYTVDNTERMAKYVCTLADCVIAFNFC